jgi:hypothetical protein
VAPSLTGPAARPVSLRHPIAYDSISTERRKCEGSADGLSMIVAIHQPQYLPWLGYFGKMLTADVFCYLDTVQYKKNEWQNRTPRINRSC